MKKQASASKDMRHEWYGRECEDVFRELETSENGLSHEEAYKRLGRHGPNVIGQEVGIDWLKVLINQVRSPLIFILFIAGAVTFFLGDYKDTAVIFAVILLNGTIGFTQEIKAEQSVRSLQKMVNPKAHVIRGGREIEIESEQVVPGDIVSLVSGTMVPADIRLCRTVDLKIDESMLTGESVPAEKSSHALETSGLQPGDQANMGFMGTVVVSGRGRGIVTDTGISTMLGGIASDIRDIGAVRAPIQDKINRFAHMIGFIVMGAAALVFLAGVLMGEPVEQMFMTAVAAAVATVPEGMPIVVTIAMAIGVKRMASVNAIVRKLPAVETLGSTSVICSDKTGTLTVNEMTVRTAYNGSDMFGLEGEGYNPEGRVLLEGREATGEERSRLAELMRIGLLCNESRIYFEEGEWKVQGDPTEAALIVAAHKAGLDSRAEAEAYREIAMLPFESERGYMATLHEYEGGKIVFVKGGHDRLMEICTACMYSEGINHRDIREKAEEMAARGERVLLFAYKKVPPDTEVIRDEDLTGGLIFVGMQSMIDPPRPEVSEAVANCKRSGIRVVMITGDHAWTATAIARQLGIASENEVAVTGNALGAMDEETFARVAASTNVFARIAPEQKYRIVEALKRQGETVAVTGDGVNDAPALKAAHIGVSMGRGGTDVAREASDMVLADDNFASIYEAVREGRIVFDNLRKVIFFLLPTGIAAIWTILMTQIFGYALPYLPAQLLWINLVTNGLQDVAMAFEPGEPGVLDRKPRSPEEGIMSRLLVQRTILVSLVIACGVILLFKLAQADGVSIEKSRTIAVTTMVFFQFFQAWNSRSEHESVFRMNPFSNRFLFISLAGAFLAQIAFVHWRPLQILFETEALSFGEWLTVAGVSSSVILVVEMDKLLRRRRA